MDKQQRALVKDFAITTTKNMDLLIKAIDAADEFHANLMNQNVLITQYSQDLSAAEARISEDEATIAIKDNQLRVAQEQYGLAVTTADSQAEEYKKEISRLTDELMKSRTPVSEV